MSKICVIEFSQKIVLISVKNGVGSLYYQAFLNKVRIRLNLKKRIAEKHFNKASEQIRAGYGPWKDINIELENVKAKATDIIVRHRLKGVALSKSEFIMQLENDGNSNSFLDYMHTQILNRKRELAEGTFRHHIKVWRRLSLYSPGLTFHQLTTTFIRDFELWLCNEHNNDINTRGHYLKSIQTYIRRAITDGLMKENPIEAIKIKRLPGKREFLERSEWKRYWNLYWEDSLDYDTQSVLAIFLFGCLTGIRLKDILKLKNSNFNQEQIRFYPNKTINSKRKEIIIPMNALIWKLIKLQGLPFQVPNTEKTIREKLKVINGICRIRKHITFHCSRHTFATNFLKSGGNVTKLRELLGHSDIRETMVYVHMAGMDAEKEMINYQHWLISD